MNPRMRETLVIPTFLTIASDDSSREELGQDDLVWIRRLVPFFVVRDLHQLRQLFNTIHLLSDKRLHVDPPAHLTSTAIVSLLRPSKKIRLMLLLGRTSVSIFISPIRPAIWMTRPLGRTMRNAWWSVVWPERPLSEFPPAHSKTTSTSRPLFSSRTCSAKWSARAWSELP